MSVSFSLQQKRTNIGYIANPVVRVHILTNMGYAPYDFLVDTGSDFTLIHTDFAEHFGVDLSKCRPKEIKGLGSQPTNMYLSKITVKITEKPIQIRCGFTKDTSPFILGTVDIFKKYNIHFDNKNRRIIFKDI